MGPTRFNVWWRFRDSNPGPADYDSRSRLSSAELYAVSLEDARVDTAVLEVRASLLHLPPQLPSFNYYDQLVARLIADGWSGQDAVIEAAAAYVEGKPRLIGKRKFTNADRTRLFWESRTVQGSPASVWRHEAMALALSKYLAQRPVSIPLLIPHAAGTATGALIRAIRYSGLVTEQDSPRFEEVERAARQSPEVQELCRVLAIFRQAHMVRVAAVDGLKALLAELTPFELLIYASLYAFERLVPRSPANQWDVGARHAVELEWDAIGNLLTWKLKSSDPDHLSLSEGQVNDSVARHLAPMLFATEPAASACRNRLSTFAELVAAQIELNEFISRSCDAFSYNNSIRFVRSGDSLEIEQLDPSASAAWRRNGSRLEWLHQYWLYRALDEFSGLPAAAQIIGRPENHEANRLAYISAMRASMRLREVYGVAEQVSTDAGEPLDIFQAALALELMSAFFRQDYLQPFAEAANSAGSWLASLRKLALDGIINGQQNRFPLTWSDRESKACNIFGWTRSDHHPNGSPAVAAAILEFWTNDMIRHAREASGVEPELYERPILGFGRTLVQLPWLVGLQNNSSAAINTLRRLGARRSGAREEARRIEANLGELLRGRGFTVLLNWQPPEEDREAGEVDLIASLDGEVLVLEVKSTYLRRTLRDAWLHSATTLRKAGRQLRKKVAAVRATLVASSILRSSLELPETANPDVHGLIVDTSIECDHDRFSGFLKVSVEELLIAIRDDAHLPSALDAALAKATGAQSEPVAERCQKTTLYPDGFGFRPLMVVIEEGRVWSHALGDEGPA